MHCYRVTTFNPAHPVYILRAKQQDAFTLARLNTTAHRSPVVALIDLPINKDSIIDQLNDPQQAIGDAPSLKAWEFVKHAVATRKYEIEPNEGSRKREARKSSKRVLDEPAPDGIGRSLRGNRKPPADPSNPHGWPAALIRK